MTIQPSSQGHRVSQVCEGDVVAARDLKYGRDVGIGGEGRLGDTPWSDRYA